MYLVKFKHLQSLLQLTTVVEVSEAWLLDLMNWTNGPQTKLPIKLPIQLPQLIISN